MRQDQHLGLPGALVLTLTLLAPAVLSAKSEPQESGADGSTHQVDLLDRHDHALRARLDLIDSARHSLDLSTFIIEPDPIALDIVWHLRQAAERGVRVRLLVDAQFNRLPKTMLAHLLDAGVEIRQYHPFRWYKLGWINTRLHDKMMLSDTHCTTKASRKAGAMILGGRNLSQPYFGIAGRLPRAYLDRELLVRGAVTLPACSYFQHLWSSSQTRYPRLGKWHPKHTEKRCKKRIPSVRSDCRRRLRDRDQALAEARKVLDQGHQSSAHPTPTPPASFTVHSVAFLADPVGDKALDIPILHKLFPQPDRIGPQLLDVFRRTKASVVIESPYLIPSRGFRRALREARKQGLAIRILTNSLLTTDNLLPQAAYRNAQRWLLNQGVDLWEYAGSESMHAKSAVLDARISIVGSYNLDPRSEHLNTEIALVIEDEAFAQALLDSMNQRLDDAWHITKDGISNLDQAQLGHEAGKRYPGVGRKKVLLMTLLRAITPLLRRQI